MYTFPKICITCENMRKLSVSTLKIMIEKNRTKNNSIPAPGNTVQKIPTTLHF